MSSGFLKLTLFLLTIFSSHLLYAAPLVKVITVKKKKLVYLKEYIGHVESIRSVDIKPRVEGYLEEVRFKEGSYVEKGQILYVIEQAPYIAELNLAKAKLKEAEAHLFKAKQRVKRLRSAMPESISKTDMDDALAQLMLAKAEVLEAKARLKKAQIYLGYTVIKAPISGLVGKSFVKEGNLVSPRT
jgi:membrane fusion protein (multidrug efflux system)